MPVSGLPPQPAVLSLDDLKIVRHHLDPRIYDGFSHRKNGYIAISTNITLLGLVGVMVAARDFPNRIH